MTGLWFNTLALEVAALCNRKCEFCPVAYNTRPDERMDEALVHKVAGELGAAGYSGRIELYIYNEPLRDAAWTLACARVLLEHAPRAVLMVATNGDYIRQPADLLAVYEAGIQQVVVNSYTKGLHARRLERLVPALEAAGVDIGGPVYSKVSRHKRTIQFMDKSDPDTFGTGIFRLTNRAGNIPEFLPAEPDPLARMCVRPFRLLNINWQGEAMVCCQDYHADVAIGNAADHTLAELWNHPVLNTYREHLHRKDRSLPLCASCDCHAGAYPHRVRAPEGPYIDPASIQRRGTASVAIGTKP